MPIQDMNTASGSTVEIALSAVKGLRKAMNSVAGPFCRFGIDLSSEFKFHQIEGVELEHTLGGTSNHRSPFKCFVPF